MKNIGAIIPAAGSGQRMGHTLKKQFLEIVGEPILYHTLKAFFITNLFNVIVVVAPLEAYDFTAEIIEKVLRETQSKVPYLIVEGGHTRQDSVLRGLKVLKGCEWVLVHDGVRPFVKLNAFFDKVFLLEPCVALSVGYPAVDTVKRVNEGVVLETLDRSGLWNVQTPQVFKFEVIKSCHEKAQAEGFQGTDDASLIEHYGYKVVVVEGERSNIKITTPFDLLVAKAILEQEGDDH